MAKQPSSETIVEIANTKTNRIEEDVQPEENLSIVEPSSEVEKEGKPNDDEESVNSQFSRREREERERKERERRKRSRTSVEYMI